MNLRSRLTDAPCHRLAAFHDLERRTRLTRLFDELPPNRRRPKAGWPPSCDVQGHSERHGRPESGGLGLEARAGGSGWRLALVGSGWRLALVGSGWRLALRGSGCGLALVGSGCEARAGGSGWRLALRARAHQWRSVTRRAWGRQCPVGDCARQAVRGAPAGASSSRSKPYRRHPTRESHVFGRLTGGASAHALRSGSTCRLTHGRAQSVIPVSCTASRSASRSASTLGVAHGVTHVVMDAVMDELTLGRCTFCTGPRLP